MLCFLKIVKFGHFSSKFISYYIHMKFGMCELQEMETNIVKTDGRKKTCGKMRFSQTLARVSLYPLFTHIKLGF